MEASIVESIPYSEVHLSPNMSGINLGSDVLWGGRLDFA